MKILILGVMVEEVTALKSIFSYCDTQLHYGIACCHLEYHDTELILVQTQIGKVNAAIVATLAIMHYQPDHIMHVGSAGSLSDKCRTKNYISFCAKA